MTRAALLALLLVGAVALAGCAEDAGYDNENSNDGDEVAGTGSGGASPQTQEESQEGTTGAYG